MNREKLQLDIKFIKSQITTKEIFIRENNERISVWQNSIREYEREIGYLEKQLELLESEQGCPNCGCKDGNHAQECTIYYNAGYGRRIEGNKN